MGKTASTCFVAVLAALPTLATAQIDAQNTRYTCERGVEIPVVYVNDAETSLAILVVEGGQILLYSEPSASGARYGWPSDGSNYVWWSKGTEATLFWRDGATNTETTLLSDCKQN